MLLFVVGTVVFTEAVVCLLLLLLCCYFLFVMQLLSL